MSYIQNRLYLGDYENASNIEWLKSHKITHIVNCAVEHKEYHPRMITYLSLNLEDSPYQPLYHVLEKSYRFIKKAINENGVVLVHCHAGISRSASVVLYYIMKNNPGLSYEKAFSFVKSKRSIIRPNEGFVKQLISVTPAVASTVTDTPVTITTPNKERTAHPYIITPSQKKRFDQPKYLEGTAQILRNVTKGSS